jgi:tetratricopeptide (TPR) repeat protein
MVNIVEHLVQQGLVVRHAGQWTLRAEAEATLVRVPEALRQLLMRRIEALPPETQRVLEVASVVGREFAVAAVAAGLQCPVEDVEAQCETLARQHHFLDDTGLAVWPDGTRVGSYRFQHALYQQVLYAQIGTARREQYHRHIGLRLEAGQGARVQESAAQLAVHFECGGEVERAVRYLQQAADNATRRNAHGELSQEFFHLASHHHDRTLMQEGYMDLGLIAFYRGDPVTARAHLEHSLRLCDTPQLSTLLFPHRYESGVRHGFYGTMVLWLLGYADQAQQWNQEALARAQQGEHTPSLASAQLFAAVLSQHRRDVAATQVYAEATLALATAQGLEHRVAQGRIMRGWALAMQGDAAIGVAHIQQGLAAVQSIGQKLYNPYHLALLAEAYGQAGQPETGLTVLDEALALVATTEERWWEAEMWRLKGELLLRLPLPDIPQATACVHQALDVARNQQARALELRAALSLSRLWQRHGKRDQGRELLTEVYSWFTEGFETPDLQEARLWLVAR